MKLHVTGLSICQNVVVGRINGVTALTGFSYVCVISGF